MNPDCCDAARKFPDWQYCNHDKSWLIATDNGLWNIPYCPFCGVKIVEELV